MLALQGCCTPPGLSPADLQAPAWRQQRGQAVWRPSPARAEMAGELLVATQEHGLCFVQFAKEPFAIAIAQAGTQGWSVSFGPEGRKVGGAGKPSPRWVWFQVARLAAGRPVDPPWETRRETGGRFLLRNRKTGETLEGFLGP